VFGDGHGDYRGITQQVKIWRVYRDSLLGNLPCDPADSQDAGSHGDMAIPKGSKRLTWASRWIARCVIGGRGHDRDET
jgi:hypothetical protein